MPKWIIKVSHHAGQCRVTIPKALVKECLWEDVKHVILTRSGYEVIKIRRFVDGESLKDSIETDPAGED